MHLIKRKLDLTEIHDWIALYDRPLPAALKRKCLSKQCTLCDVKFDYLGYEARDHYHGSTHNDNVEEYFKREINDESERPKRVESSSIKQTTMKVPTSRNLPSDCTKVSQQKFASLSPSLEIFTKSGQCNLEESSSNNEPPQLHYCHICDVTLSSKDYLKQHLLGNQHQRKSLHSNKLEEPSYDEPPQLHHCHICNVTLSSKYYLKQHLLGNQHQQKSLQSVTTPVSTNTQTNHSNFGPFSQPTRFQKWLTEQNNATENRLKCNFCDYISVSTELLKQHKNEQHHQLQNELYSWNYYFDSNPNSKDHPNRQAKPSNMPSKNFNRKFKLRRKKAKKKSKYEIPATFNIGYDNDGYNGYNVLRPETIRSYLKDKWLSSQSSYAVHFFGTKRGQEWINRKKDVVENVQLFQGPPTLLSTVNQ